ncbi:MAG: LysR family transcriptional regulator [Rhodospirillales bacterium]|jgi:DNA-binding transcriptional LysR family regulator|nr:LysR family transcriptional regulator [Rhodospirillales bacterium]
MLRYSLRQMEYFIATAECQSVADAARKLNVSQPSVSKAISNMEGQFKTQLFIRHHARGVSLTQAGERLLIDARSLLRYANDLQQSALDSGDIITGQVEVACFMNVAPIFMPALIADFRQIYENIMIRLHEGDQDRMISGLISGRFELALMFDLIIPNEISMQKMAAFHPYILLPEGHPQAKKKVVSLHDMMDDNLVLLDVPPSREYFLSIFRSLELEPNISFSSPSLEMVRGMVGQGQGYSLLVTHPHLDFTYDGQMIATRPLADDIPRTELGIARHGQIRPTRVMNLFSDFCEQWFKKHYPRGGSCRAEPPHYNKSAGSLRMERAYSTDVN